MDILLKNVRLSFPTLFEPQEFKPGDNKPRWSATFLVEPGSDNDKAIRAAIENEAKVTWGAKAPAQLKTMAGQGNKYCYIDGDTKAYDGYAGKWALSCHRAAKAKNGAEFAPPLLVDTDGKSVLTAKSGRPYAGCFVNAKVSIYCQPGENAGVRASFTAVQYASKGEAFAANTPSADGFDDLGNLGEDLDELAF